MKQKERLLSVEIYTETKKNVERIEMERKMKIIVIYYERTKII